MKRNVVITVIFLGLLTAGCSKQSKTDMPVNPIAADTKWKLIELMGEPVQKPAEGQKRPYIMFSAENGRVMGFSGCNNFAGRYELKKGDHIAFSKIAATQMACDNMEKEVKFLKVLDTVDSFKVSDNILVFSKENMTPFAKFKKAPNDKQ